MRRTERIVFAFRSLGETGKSTFHAQRANAVAASRQDLVRIRLVADVPDQPVVRRVEDIVQRHRQLDHAKTGAKMPAGARNRVDQLDAQFLGELRQIALGQRTQIRGNSHLVEQGCVRRLVQFSSFTCVQGSSLSEIGAIRCLVNAERQQFSRIRQRNELYLVAGYDVEAAGSPLFLGLLDALLGGGNEVPPDVAVGAERGAAEQHEMRTVLRRHDNLVARTEYQ